MLGLWHGMCKLYACLDNREICRMAQRKNLVKFRGIITPCAWAVDGSVTQICLADENENEHLLALSGVGKALMGHQQELVEVRGNFISDKEKRNIFVVSKFDVIKNLHTGKI